MNIQFTKKYQILLQLFVLAGCLLVVIAPNVVQAKLNQNISNTLEFGVFPYFPLRELEKIYAPIAANFSEHLGVNIAFRSSSSYGKFRDIADNQVFDIVFVQPFDYVRLADKYGYVPLATHVDRLKAVFAAKNASVLTKLTDLRGKKIAFPPPSAAVSLLLRAYLRQQGLFEGRDISISYHSTHVSCMQQVLIGNADVCGTEEVSMQFFANRMRVKMKIIARTQPIPHVLFAAHPRVSEKQRDELIKTILSWNDSENGRQFMGRANFGAFVKITDKDYDVVRAISHNLKSDTLDSGTR
ncbi:MAG: phosphate/phosphite/phosphonate ABC transporter substrate-binding protein [Thiohalomonadales bacterium]